MVAELVLLLLVIGPIDAIGVDDEVVVVPVADAVMDVCLIE